MEENSIDDKESNVSDSEESKEVKKRTGKIVGFLKNKKVYTYLLIALLLFAFILRLTYFDINEAVWWDSADYLTGAKVWGQNLDLNYDFNPRRPFFMSLLWAGFYKLGLGEKMLHFSEVIFSMFSIFLVYLIGRDMFNKKVGLIAAFGLSVFWLHLFHTARLLSDVPALTFWLATVFFLYKGYMKKENGKYLWLAGFFLGLTLFTRTAYFIMLFPLMIYIISKEKLGFLKNKNFWIAMGLAFLAISPYIIYNFAIYDNPIEKITGLGSGEERFVGAGNFMKLYSNLPIFHSTLLWVFLALSILGFVLFFDLIIGFDKIFKNEKVRKRLFLLLWVLTPYFFHSLTAVAINEPRYLFGGFAGLFIVFGYGVMFGYNQIKKYNKYIAVVFLVLVLVVGGYNQVVRADGAIKVKAQSYKEVKDAGIWLYENTEYGDKVVSQSIYQNMYYSERYTFDFHGDDGALTEEEFNLKVKKERPKYMVVSAFEPGFTPNWVYTYGDRNQDKVKPAMVYPAANGRPILIIFEFIGEYKGS